MRVAVIGGTGFVGGYLLDALAGSGHDVSVLVRPGSESKLRPLPGVRAIQGDLSSVEAIRETLEGCDAVIYNVGILREFPRRGITYEGSQYEGVVRTVDTASDAGVSRMLLMSANGVKRGGTPYQDTKRRAEEYALQSDLDLTVFRPSVIFGDPRGTMEFATQLYRDMIRPPLPAVGFFSGADPKKGAILMSPVHIDDVATAFVTALEDDSTIGKTYELGGPEVLTWQEMITRIADATGKSKIILPMPTWVMRAGATLFDWLPFFPVTRDQLTMLEDGNTADPAILEGLTGAKPKAFASANLGYLAR